MIKKLFFSFCLILVASILTQAQETVTVLPIKSWTWSNYKIDFNAPTDLKVKESSTTVYYAGNDHVYLTIYPKKGDSLTHDNLPTALQKWAASHKVSFSSANAGYLTNNNRLWNYYLAGNGYKGMSTYVSVLVDSSHPEDSYYVWLQYQNGYADAAINILKSFFIQ